MIGYDEALKKAKELKPNIDACDEYDTAYLFKARSEEYCIGGDGACVILKKDGRALNQLEFFDSYDHEHIREFDL